MKSLVRLNILPSWFILFIDVVLLTLTTFTCYFIFIELGVVFLEEFPFKYRFAIVISVYSFWFLVFRTYTGVVRYSRLNDIGRLFKSIFTSYFTLILINYIYNLLFNKHIFLYYTLFFTCVFVFFVLSAFRILVKKTFQYLDKEPKFLLKENIAIIGVNSHNISLIETLTSPKSKFNLICFLDLNDSLNGKKVANINVFADSKRSIISYLRLKNIKNIVLTKGYLPEDIEEELIEECINKDIKVFKPELINNIEKSNETLKTYNLEELLFRDTIEINNTKIIDKFFNKTILVTGGAGSIGSELTKQLGKFQPKHLIILDQAETPLYEIELYFQNNLSDCSCSFELVDVTNKIELETIYVKYRPEIVFHAAAYKHVPLLEKNYRQAIKVNIFGTKNCLDLALNYGVKNFVFISTDKAVNPTNIMGASKRFAEMLVQTSFNNEKNIHKTQVISTRFGNVLGSNGSVVNLFKKQILSGGPITVTHPEVNRFFMTIPEACKLVIEAGAMGSGGQTYLFDMGRSIKIVDLAEKMIRLAGKRPNKDIKIEFTGLRPGEKLFEEVLTESAETLDTYHSKIVIAIEETPCVSKLEEIYTNLQRIYQIDDRKGLIEELKRIVPGFHPDSTIL